MDNNIYDGLNDEQRQAVDFDRGSCLVVAGPGSGKTTVLTRRIASLIERGVPAQSILLITFTRIAAKNMTDRAKVLSPDAADICGGTFHSVASRLIKENASVFRLPENPTILLPSDVKSAIKRLIADRMDTKENRPDHHTIAEAHSYAINTQQPLDDVIADRHPELLYCLDFIRQIVEDYKQFKRERLYFDYDDLMLLWLKLMQHPTIGAAIRARFTHVMVDEYQDCNKLQNAIIDLLGDNVMVVGDPAQSIYAFRGSAPRTMFAFAETHPDAVEIQLNMNYRSTSEVIDVVNAVDQMMSERFNRNLVSNTGYVKRMPELVTVPNVFEEANYVCDRILEAKANGTPLHEQAILVRSMRFARIIELELVKRRIPYKVVGGITLHEAAHCNDFISLARCASNTLDDLAWTRVLTKIKGIGEKKAAAICESIRGGGMFAEDPAEIILRATSKWPLAAKIVDAWRVVSEEGRPAPLLARALEIMTEVFEKAYPDDWKARKSDIEAIIAIADQYDTLDAFLTTVSIDVSIDKTADANASKDEERPLVLSTIHSAKGLEWQTVYVPNFTEGHIPSLRAQEAEEIEEEKRILFVALSRPKRNLVVTKPGVTRINGNDVVAPESSFQRYIIENFDTKRHGRSSVPVSFALDLDQSVQFDPFDF